MIGEETRPERSGDLPKVTLQGWGWDLNLYLTDSKVTAFIYTL